MRKLIYYFAIILLLPLTGCPGFKDSFVSEELGNGYVFYEEGGFPIICRDIPNRKCIPAVVKDYDYDKNYIIALQKEYKFKRYEIEEYSIEQQYKIIDKKGKLKYWIIDKVNDSIYGPYSKDEFILKRNVLGVPKELKLE